MARVAGVCDERILLLIHCLLAAERAPPALMNLTPRAIFPGVFSPEPETAEAGKGLGLSLIILKRFGAEEGTRTPTPLRVRGPEPRASANSATSAQRSCERSRWTAATASVTKTSSRVKPRISAHAHHGT